MDANAFFNELLEEIRVDERALEEKKELARLMRHRLQQMKPANTTISVPAVRIETRGEAPSVAPSLVQMVERALPILESREFVVSDVAEALRSNGAQLSNKPNPKIATVLARLQSTGALTRTFTGGGNVPNRYRVTSSTRMVAGES